MELQDVVVCGGYNGGLSKDNCFAYDLSAGTAREWREISSLTEPRKYSAAAVVNVTNEDGGMDELLWVTGGHGIGGFLQTTEFLAMSGDDSTVSRGPSIPDGETTEHCLTRLNSTHVFMSGGFNKSSAFLYSLEDDVWTRLPDMIGGVRYAHVCGMKSENEVVVVGGSGISSSEMFSLAGWEWTEGPELPGVVGYASAVQSGSNDGFYVIGGHDGSRTLDTVIKFESSADGGQFVEREERLALPRRFAVAVKLQECP